MVISLFIFGCSSNTLILKDKLRIDTYYLDLRPNQTHQKGVGSISKILNFSDETVNMTFYEDVQE